MFSIFHFFADLLRKQSNLFNNENLEAFPFDETMFSCRRKGKFPDMAIRINANSIANPLLSGGELIEIKDSKFYQVSSFNSTIPAGEKYIRDVEGLSAKIKEFKESVDALPLRQIYYLLRGRKSGAVKICLVHGSFFETVNAKELIPEAFRQVLNISDSDGNPILSDEKTEQLLSALSDQSNFAASRNVKNSSVSIRFRVMTEAKKEANILQHTNIGDNTANLIIPLHGKQPDRENQVDLILQSLESCNLPEYKNIIEQRFFIKHPFNGYFLVLQDCIAKNNSAK